MIKVLTTLSNNSAEGVTSTGLLKTPLALSASLQVVEDYAGTDSPLYLSTTQVAVQYAGTVDVIPTTTFGLINTAAATSGHIQYSPPLVMVGSGFTGSSKQIGFRQYVVPTSGTTGYLGIDASVDGALASWGNLFRFDTPASVVSTFRIYSEGTQAFYLAAGYSASAIDMKSLDDKFHIDTRTGSDYMYLGTGMKLGINKTSSLAAQLDIVAASATVGLYVKGAASTNVGEYYTSTPAEVMTVGVSGGNTTRFNGAVRANTINTYGNTASIIANSSGGATAASTIIYDGEGNATIYIKNITTGVAGNVGIGTTSPLKPLHVIGGIALTAGTANDTIESGGVNSVLIKAGNSSGLTINPQLVTLGSWNGTQFLYAASGGSGNSNRTGIDLVIGSGQSTGNGNGGSLLFQYTPIGISGTQANPYSTAMAISGANGNIGIGTSTPFSGATGALGLEVGTGIASEYTIRNGYSTLGVIASGGWGVVGSNYYFDSTNNVPKFSYSDYSSIIEFNAGGWKFKTSTSTGSANDNVTFTEVFGINKSGNVGIGTTSPSYKLDIQTATAGIAIMMSDSNTNNTDKESWFVGKHYAIAQNPVTLIGNYSISGGNYIFVGGGGASKSAATHILFYTGATSTTNIGTEQMRIVTTGVSINKSTNAAQLDIVAASATVGLYVKGAASTDIARFYDSAGVDRVFINSYGELNIRGNPNTCIKMFYSTGGQNTQLFIDGNGSLIIKYAGNKENALFDFNGSVLMGDGYLAQASSRLEINSTTKGFLPPRMTTAQKNAIASPATGLMVFDSDLVKLCVYTTAWETITSI